MSIPPFAISGEPGTAWTNRTETIYYQAKVQFRNSCAVCISVANLIARYWPFPFHFRCHCRNVPIVPGATASPFLDYQEELAGLEPSQQTAAMGRSNWTILRSGLVSWDDIITRSRIRPFHEVVARKKLTIEQLVDAGVTKGRAAKAWATTHTAEHAAADHVRATVVEALRQHGLTTEEIAGNVGARVAERFGLKGPSGAFKVKVFPRGGEGAAAALLRPKPIQPITPATARQRLVDEFGEDALRGVPFEEIQTEADVEAVAARLRASAAKQREYADQLGFMLPAPQ